MDGGELADVYRIWCNIFFQTIHWDTHIIAWQYFEPQIWEWVAFFIDRERNKQIFLDCVNDGNMSGR